MLKPELVRQLNAVVGSENVLTRKGDRIVYECDGFTIQRTLPGAVVLPGTPDEVQRVVKILHEARVPFLPRGAGTGLSGGAIPSCENSVVIPLTRLNKIQAVDFRNRRALVEAGAINVHVSQIAGRKGYHFAPDPSSQSASTIGGNVAENAGGPHTLKYGVTVNHIEALELVLPDGRRYWTHNMSPSMDGGFDIAGLLCGSEGTLGLVTRAIVRLVRAPQSIRTLLAVFDSIEDATQCVSSIIAQGIIPAALEMMDQVILKAVEAAFQVGLPADAGAVLLVELDGLEAGIDKDLGRIERICQEHRSRDTRLAVTAEERDNVWRARRLAVAALGRLAPSYVTQDGVVPRTKLPEILRHVAHVSKQYDIPIANLMHAGDGNLHPILLFDEREQEQVQRVLQASAAILTECIALGGTVTGEHGIGVEKIDFMPHLFSPEDIRVMLDVRSAFNPEGLCNPGKLFPTEKQAVPGIGSSAANVSGL